MATATFCPTCQASLPTADRRTHLKTDWHIYNLKRVVADLPPICETEFSKKQATFLSTVSVPVSGKKFHCQCCKKSFNSQKSYGNHIGSKQHQANIEDFKNRSANAAEQTSAEVGKISAEKQINTEEEEKEEEEDSWTSFPLPVGACLFCDRSFTEEVRDVSDAASRVLTHMADCHRFSLPDADRLIDPVSLLAELGRLVGEEYACLACGRQFHGRVYGEVPSSARQRRRIALAAVRAHMRDAKHQYLYCGPDDPVHIALAVAEAEEAIASDGRRELRAGSLPPVARVGGELYSQFYQPERADRTLVVPDNDETAFELRLPSGAVLGHRKFYQTVYRQNLPPAVNASEARRRALALTHTSCCLPLSLTAGQRNQNNANSGALLAVSDAAGRGHLRVSRLEVHQQTVQRTICDKYNLDLGMRGNLVLRGHLRRQY
uniref:C2H2-type domain-containing protein n=1 Tax=Schistocephalus solidus TaxID=70667 RepID=A0A0X3Q1M4_SCHSO